MWGKKSHPIINNKNINPNKHVTLEANFTFSYNLFEK